MKVPKSMLEKQDDGSYPRVPPGYYQEVLGGLLDDDAVRAVDNHVLKMLSDPEQADRLLSMFDSYFDFDE